VPVHYESPASCRSRDVRSSTLKLEVIGASITKMAASKFIPTSSNYCQYLVPLMYCWNKGFVTKKTGRRTRDEENRTMNLGYTLGKQTSRSPLSERQVCQRKAMRRKIETRPCFVLHTPLWICQRDWYLCWLQHLRAGLFLSTSNGVFLGICPL
jgi:hypothetical protein